MAESLESLVEKFRINLTEAIQKFDKENQEKEATLEAKHQQELELLGEKECVEKEELDAKQKVEREELDAKQSQRLKDLTVKQHQEKVKLKNDYGKKLKATTENKMCPNTSKKEVPECPVCLEPLNPPMKIFQCSYGHFLCEGCNNNKEIKSCPTCRRQIVGRNIGMEQAIQLIGAPTDKEVVGNQQKSGVESLIDDRGPACDSCTLINKEGDKFCDACGTPLGMVYSPIRPARMNTPDFSSFGRVAEGRRGHFQSSVGLGRGIICLDFPPSMRLAEGRPAQSRPVGLGRGRSRLQCLNETTTSGQSRPLYVRRRFPPRINAARDYQTKATQAVQFQIKSMYNGRRFPPPVPPGHSMGVNRYRMNDVEGNNHIHVPTGRLVELETQSPPGNSAYEGEQERRGREEEEW